MKIEIKIPTSLFSNETESLDVAKAEQLLVVTPTFSSVSTAVTEFGDNVHETINQVLCTYTLDTPDKLKTALSAKSVIKVVEQMILDYFVSDLRVRRNPNMYDFRAQKSYGNRAACTVFSHNKKAWPDRRETQCWSLHISAESSDIARNLLFTDSSDSEERNLEGEETSSHD